MLPLSYFCSMKGTIWITEKIMVWSDGHITLDNEILSWDLLFKVYGNIWHQVPKNWVRDQKSKSEKTRAWRFHWMDPLGSVI